MTARLPDPQLPEPPESAGTRPSRVRRYTLIGLSAGLLGGAAVGLAGTAPLSSQAADLPTLAAAPDDTVAPDDTDDADATPEVSEGGWVREALQPLVDDGTLTAEQLETIVATLQDARPLGPRGGGGHGPFGRDHGNLMLDRDEVAAVLGLDVDTLAEQLRDGSSLAAIAEAQGVDIETVIDLLVADAEARMAERVEDGSLTEDEAAERAAELRERVTDMVNRERGARPGDDPAEEPAG